jgi:hypothetical protein
MQLLLLPFLSIDIDYSLFYTNAIKEREREKENAYLLGE